MGKKKRLKMTFYDWCFFYLGEHWGFWEKKCIKYVKNEYNKIFC